MCLTSMYCLQCYSELTERHFNPSSSASTRREGNEKSGISIIQVDDDDNNNNRVCLFTITVFGL